MKSCRARDNPDASDASENESDNRTTVDPISASISVTVQRHNAQMIIERQPPPPTLLAAGIEKSHQAAVRVKEWTKKKLRRDPNGNGPMSRMVWECPPATTPVTKTPQHLQHSQHQPEETNAQSNSLTEAHTTQKKTKGPRVEVTNSVSYATPPPIRRDAHTDGTVNHVPRQTKVTARSDQGKRKHTPPVAHNTQNTPPNTTCGGTRQLVLVPDPSGKHPKEMHPQGAHPHTLSKHGADYFDMDMDTESPLRHAPAMCEPNQHLDTGNQQNQPPNR